MSTKIFGYEADELKVGQRFSIDSSTTGAWTATQEFTCRYTDYANVEIRTKLQKGTRLIDLNPNIPSVYDFLTLEDYTIEHQKGGITRIDARFAGAAEDDSEFGGGEERSTSTSFRGVLSQKPIIEHPVYAEDVLGVGGGGGGGAAIDEQNAIAKLWANEAILDIDGAERYIRLKTNQWEQVGPINDPDVIKWIDMIAQGRRFYEGQQLEWEVTQTNKGGLQDDDLEGFGKLIETPPRNPPEPDWKDENRGWWQFTNISEDNDENVSVFTRTYSLRDERYDLTNANDPVKLLYT